MHTIRTLMLAVVLATLSMAAQAAEFKPAPGPELVSIERVQVGGQEVSLAATRAVQNGQVQICHQYVESFKRQIAPTGTALSTDNVTIVLGTRCASH
ncbi:hypothetical protein [Cupriavidus sp. TMH.W2]|uniref:hypothetical protein n=1 Tax=Cupriavidus sp. TMH.W2 TaxID=3434465 RepID=UPI003D76EDEF